jgi:hypothetical protein
MWVLENGVNLDWWSTTGKYKTGKCPSGRECRHTYWLCGECVHDHWIGNFMFGYLGRLLRQPDLGMNALGQRIQGSDPDSDDPPWDVAGYGLGRLVYDELTDPKGGMIELCDALKSNQDLWNTANNTTPRLDSQSIDIGVWIINKTPNWPIPRALHYRGCRQCPERLPPAVKDSLPGGKFPKGFPDIK